MRNATIILAVAAVLALAVPAWGQYWGRTPGDPGDWVAGTNWVGGAAPTATTTARIGHSSGSGGGAIVNISGTDAAVCLNFGLGYLSTTSYIYHTDGTLTLGAAGGSYIGGITASGGGVGIYNHSGGVLNAGSCPIRLGYYLGSSVGTYNLSGTGRILTDGITLGGNTDFYGLSGLGTGYFNISGGSVATTGLFDVGGTGTGFLKVTGSWEVAGIGDEISLGSYTQRAGGTLTSEINATGIETIVVTGAAAAAFAGNLTVTDAGAAYGTYTLMTYASQTGSFGGTISLPSADWSYNLGATALTVTYVPEPATLALLGLGGIGVLLRRKRR